MAWLRETRRKKYIFPPFVKIVLQPSTFVGTRYCVPGGGWAKSSRTKEAWACGFSRVQDVDYMAVEFRRPSERYCVLRRVLLGRS